MKNKRRAGWWRRERIGVVILAASLCAVGAFARQGTSAANGHAAVQKLGADFWAWRAEYAPFTSDDVPRIERGPWPDGKRDWSAAAVTKRREELKGFEARLEELKPRGWTVADQVDYRLLGSAMARVRWELEVWPRWRRDPNFYIEQTLTPVLEAIAVPGPYDAARSKEILGRIENVPGIVKSAEENLLDCPQEFVNGAIGALGNVGAQVRSMAEDLRPATTLKTEELKDATDRAARALEAFREWLKVYKSAAPGKVAMGREALNFYLHKVALLPYSLDELRVIGDEESARADAFVEYESKRDKDEPELKTAADAAAWATREAKDESEIREFLRKHGIVTVPAWVQHYTFAPIPAYVKALEDFGETDDFTSATRLKENAVRYVDTPAEVAQDFFWNATAKDPRPIILHEGVPGHYLQLVLSWANDDPIRRHFYDSAPNEGLGFYCEEMMLQEGLFDDSPRTREIIYRFMLLRALGIELDVKMALGEFTVEQAAAVLEKRLGFSHEMAMGGMRMFAEWGGVILEYQAGKTQVMRFLADAKAKEGDKFDVRAFDDFVWKNGNVPVALQRWERLGIKDEVEKLERFNK